MFFRVIFFVLCLATALPAAASTRIVMYGDSLTEGYGLAHHEALPTRLEAALQARGLEVEVINEGVSGDTTTSALPRLKGILSTYPDVVLVALGANDALRRQSTATMEKNLRNIFRQIKDYGAKAALLGIEVPLAASLFYGSSFEDVYANVADDLDIPFCENMLEDVALDPALNQSDRIHPNAKGVEKVVENILPTVLDVLGERQDGPWWWPF